MSKHIPEPFDQPMPVGETWAQCPNNGYDILIDNGDFVGAFVHDDIHSKFSRARCARAVSCVNTLAGFDDLTKVKALLDAIRAEASSYHDDSISHALHTKNCDHTESQVLQLVVSLGSTDNGTSGDTQTGP